MILHQLKENQEDSENKFSLQKVEGDTPSYSSVYYYVIGDEIYCLGATDGIWNWCQINSDMTIQNTKPIQLLQFSNLYSTPLQGEYIYYFGYDTGKNIIRIHITNGDEQTISMPLGLDTISQVIDYGDQGFRIVGKKYTPNISNVFLDFNVAGTQIGEPIIVPINADNTVLNLIPLN